MKELLKKASLTVASACLIAGGLVSVGWAASNQSEQSASHQNATMSEKGEEAGLPKEITVNGQVYRQVTSCGPGSSNSHIGCAGHGWCPPWRRGCR